MVLRNQRTAQQPGSNPVELRAQLIAALSRMPLAEADKTLDGIRRVVFANVFLGAPLSDTEDQDGFLCSDFARRFVGMSLPTFAEILEGVRWHLWATAPVEEPGTTTNERKNLQ